jgi:hypothetical protein
MGYPWEAQKGRTAGPDGLAAVSTDKYIDIGDYHVEGSFDVGYRKVIDTPNPRFGEIRYRLDYIIKNDDGVSIAKNSVSAKSLGELPGKAFAKIENDWKPGKLTDTLRSNIEFVTREPHMRISDEQSAINAKAYVSECRDGGREIDIPAGTTLQDIKAITAAARDAGMPDQIRTHNDRDQAAVAKILGREIVREQQREPGYQPELF